MAPQKDVNRSESVNMMLGLVVLIFGLVLLMVSFVIAFTIATNPSGFLGSQIPDAQDASVKGPRAEFRFTINDLTVNFEDATQQGDASIVSWEWDFGDGQINNQQNPQHNYLGNFTGNVRLTVRDANDKQSSALGNVQVHPGASSSGNSMPDIGDIGSALNIGDVMGPVVNVAVATAAAMVTFFMLFIMWLVGASITKTGWNLMRPKPETIRVRIKPKDLEVEPVYPTTYVTQPSTSQYAPPPPRPSTQQPPPPE